MTDVESTRHPAPEDLAAYLLDGDDAAVASHLETCPECAEEARSLAATLGALALAAPDAEPPVALRERILAAAEAPPAVVDLGAERERRRRRLPLIAIAAAAAVIVALVIGSLRGPSFEIERQVALPGVGVVEVDGDRARLAAEASPAPPAGQTYQIWIIRAGGATSGGTYDAAGRVEIAGRVRAGDVIAVTLEPDGGSPQPTREPLATAAL